MAKVTKTPAKAPAKKTGTAIANVQAINDQLAQRAQALSTQLGPQGGGPRINHDHRAGTFNTADGEVLGESIRVIVVDFVLAHRLYSGIYDPKNLQPPICAAVGHDFETLAPQDNAPDPQAEFCKVCPMNAFGSDARGSGKACKNTRDCAVLLVNDDGTVEDKLYMLTIPPTGLKSFDGAARFIARTYQSTPIRCILTLTSVNRGEYNTVETSDPEPNPDYAEHVSLLEAAAEMVEKRVDFTAREQASKPAKKAPAKRPVTPRVAQRR